MLLLTVGVVGLIATFDGARKLTLVSERQTSAAHRAQWEMEKLQAEPYGELAMISAPSHSTESTNPDYYVNASCAAGEGAGCYAPNAEKTSEEEIIVYGHGKTCGGGVETECGLVAASPSGKSCSENPIGSCEWKDGLISGAVYDFVTWHSDVVCEKEESGKKLCYHQGIQAHHGDRHGQHPLRRPHPPADAHLDADRSTPAPCRKAR